MTPDPNSPVEERAVHLRTFRMADYGAVLALWQAAGLQGWSLVSREEVRRKRRRDPELFLVACLEGRIVGTVMGAWDGRRGWAYNVVVDPAQQRRGIGRALMGELEARLWSKGARVLNLHYFRESTWARDFYHALGFVDASNAICTQKVLREPGG